jgi:hypothetical protein
LNILLLKKLIICEIINACCLLHDADLERVKALMQALGVNYIVAPGDADVMCAQMVLKRKAHACMSDGEFKFVKSVDE